MSPCAGFTYEGGRGWCGTTTWNQFTSTSVKGWDNRSLYYYLTGAGFSVATHPSALDLLQASNSDGQCSTFANLLKDSLAVNGISASVATVNATDGSAMVVKNWQFGSPTLTGGLWDFVTGAGGEMVVSPPMPDDKYGDLTNATGTPGQNSPTPSEKVFGVHYIVKVSLADIGGPYFDPSYGASYADEAEFQSTSIAGYAQPYEINAQTGLWSWAVRQPSVVNNNITIVP